MSEIERLDDAIFEARRALMGVNALSRVFLQRRLDSLLAQRRLLAETESCSDG